MCGILITYGINKNAISDALNKIHNRGPFNQGEIYLNNVGIGMVQLPMKSQHTDTLPVKYHPYYVSYNGEIFRRQITYPRMALRCR